MKHIHHWIIENGTGGCKCGVSKDFSETKEQLTKDERLFVDSLDRLDFATNPEWLENISGEFYETENGT